MPEPSAPPKRRRTKIVATIGPVSKSPDVMRKLIEAGMNVARLNFSHGDHADHAQVIADLRKTSEELDTPVTILQDLQGPKVRVGQLSSDSITLEAGEFVDLVPEEDYSGQSATIPIDYPSLAEEAKAGMQVLLADGLMELRVDKVEGRKVHCVVVEEGELKSRKGVNFPELNLRLPALTDRDREDLRFGVKHGVDWVSLSFVRSAEDVRLLKEYLAELGGTKLVIAKIEKPQAVENLDEILDEVNGIMVARGDLGVELRPETVPMIQKRVIEQCNRRGIPVITATQMLESMVNDPRPTRAEASDVANAIIDGTDAVMLSAESAVGLFPVRAVKMMARIAEDVEHRITFKNYSAVDQSISHALSEAALSIEKILMPRYIAVMTTTGHTAHSLAQARPRAPVVAITLSESTYHSLNLFWGIQPLLVKGTRDNFEGLVVQAQNALKNRRLVRKGEKMLVIGGIPALIPLGANFIKIHTVT